MKALKTIFKMLILVVSPRQFREKSNNIGWKIDATYGDTSEKLLILL
ncbi:MAG: hypothetical protein QXI93_02385 [Candidatus Methanomethylicia archaeon]